MLDVQKTKLEQALRILMTLTDHVRFAVEFNGRVIGNSELVTAKAVRGGKGKRNLRYPMGTLSAYLAPYLDNLATEGVVEIPWGQFDYPHLSSSVTAACSKRFGKGMATTTTNKINNTIEVWLDPSVMESASKGQPDLFSGWGDEEG